MVAFVKLSHSTLLTENICLWASINVPTAYLLILQTENRETTWREILLRVNVRTMLKCGNKTIHVWDDYLLP